jgi:hypothetical protein
MGATNMGRFPFIFLLLCLILTACSQGSQSVSTSGSPGSGNSNPSIANGEEIYFTSTDARGNRIKFTGGPNFGGMMMGSYLTCAACHGPEAYGGQHVIHMEVMDAPAIYGDALIKMKVEDSGGTPQPGGYTLQEFRSAVVEGKDSSGKSLNQDMPRWQMSDSDLADLFTFLESLK